MAGLSIIKFYYIFYTIFLTLLTIIGANSVRRITQKAYKEFNIQIQGYSPSESDDYVAVSVKAIPGYIEKFEPFAHADRVHHMLLYGCTEPAYSGTEFWRGQATCSSGMHILYAWARNAPPLQLPENVAFAVGNPGDPVQHLVLQIHYARQFDGKVRDFTGVTLHMSDVKPKFVAGVYLFVSGEPIPPRLPASFNNISCAYSSDTQLHPFAFRTHTHQMGRVVSAYVKHKDTGNWEQIGKRNPQWPQLFQLRTAETMIKNGDFLGATCRFDSSDKDKYTPMGSMGKNEMCNFYMMFYRNYDDPDPFPYGAGCFGNEDAGLMAREYPVEGTTLLPAHPDWEHTAHQSEKPFGVIERERITELGGIKLGQIAGLAVDSRQRVFVFHRAGRTWGQGTFDMNNQLQDKTPIQTPVVLIAEINKASNKLELVEKYGAGQFYLPHGIFVDDSNYVYTTDVGSHQVIKWQIQGGKLKPVWTLGEKFVTGSDHAHFCKPAGIAVSKLDGSVYVADGYCNNRVVKFSKDGVFLLEFGHPSPYDGTMPRLGQFSLPHDITLDEKRRHIYVADRENGRVQIFTDQGDPIDEIRRPRLFTTVYSVSYYSPIGLVFVPGTSAPLTSGQSQEINVYVVPDNSEHIQFAFRPESDFFRIPHVIRASHGNTIWVGEIADSAGILWRMEVQSSGAPKIPSKAFEPHQNPAVMSIGVPARISEAVSAVPVSSESPISAYLLVTIMLAFLFLVICFAAKKCCCSTGNGKGSNGTSFDRKGFKPLKTTELDDDISMDDESGNELEEEARNITEGQGKGRF